MNSFRIGECEWLAVDVANSLVVDLLTCRQQVGRGRELATLGNGSVMVNIGAGVESDHTVMDSVDDEVCFQEHAVWIDDGFLVNHVTELLGEVPEMIELLASLLHNSVYICKTIPAAAGKNVLLTRAGSAPHWGLGLDCRR